MRVVRCSLVAYSRHFRQTDNLVVAKKGVAWRDQGLDGVGGDSR